MRLIEKNVGGEYKVVLSRKSKFGRRESQRFIALEA
jgi:hypothetical protein